MSEKEIRSILGETAVEVFGFDREIISEAAQRVGPQLSDIQQQPA